MCISFSLIVVQPDHLETSNVCLKMFSEEILSADQLLSEAHLCQGQLWTPLATGNMVRTVNYLHFEVLVCQWGQKHKHTQCWNRKVDNECT